MRVFDVVVAIDRDRGIARGGLIPWRLPADMAHFKRLTRATEATDRENAVIMGRKTWQSIPARFRPLAGRLNVVLSRNPALQLPPGVIVATSLQGALEGLDSAGCSETVERIFVIGGGAIYAQSVNSPSCRDLYVTRIDSSFACDTFFPDFESGYERISTMSEGRDNGWDYRIEVWRNRAFAPGRDDDAS